MLKKVKTETAVEEIAPPQPVAEFDRPNRVEGETCMALLVSRSITRWNRVNRFPAPATYRAETGQTKLVEAGDGVWRR